jgi:hypothetical protein
LEGLGSTILIKILAREDQPLKLVNLGSTTQIKAEVSIGALKEEVVLVQASTQGLLPQHPGKTMHHKDGGAP